jgi:hypothetical protein
MEILMKKRSNKTIDFWPVSATQDRRIEEKNAKNLVTLPLHMLSMQLFKPLLGVRLSF